MNPEDLQKVYANTFESEQGERCLEDLGKRCYAFASTLNADINRMAFNEGRRSVYLEIEAILKMDIKKMEDLRKKLEAGGAE